MKIAFEVDKKEAHLLLRGLKRLMGQTQNPKTLNALQKIFREIDKDVRVEEIVFRNLEYKSRDFRNTNVPFLRTSDLREGLRMGAPFVEATNGLRLLSQHILKNLVLKTKPGKQVPRISLTPIKKCKTVKNVVDVIVKYYEKV